MLQLDAMTIHGIGSYVRGSRLEVRPLTILSGVNGSGKSTWFNTLAMLRKSLSKKEFPFVFDVDDSDAYDVGFMNYGLHVCGDRNSGADSDQQYRDFGPAACVGLELSVIEDFQLPTVVPAAVDWVPQNPEQRLLVDGSCVRGTKIRIRLAHPTGDSSDRMFHKVELSVNGNNLEFLKPHVGGSHNSENSIAGNYKFGGSPSFGNWMEGALRPLAADRIAKIVAKFFEGYFHIPAIREVQKGRYTEKIAPPKTSHDRRNVGIDVLRAINILDWNRAPRLASDEQIEPQEKEIYDGIEHLLGIQMWRPEGTDEPNQCMARFDSLYLGGSQVPRQFSSGLHQLLPIVVQLAVMGSGELLSIENPEVHLHPDLQLKVSEYLLNQSRRGRRIMIETHSDLIIRRVVRAILAEEEGLSQQHVSLNFSEPEKHPDLHGGVGSILRQYKVDKEGCIEWPEGFMDASINESERLMEVMYGKRTRREGGKE